MNKKTRLPGDLSTKDEVAEMIRVNLAGEFGAKRIYEGQLALLGKSLHGPIIQHMKQQELEHLQYFEQELVKRKIRPSLLLPFWNFSGYLLGFTTAMLGHKAAMACTEAIEDVIDQHYQQQTDKIKELEPELASKIEKFRQEEVLHKNIAIENESRNAPLYIGLNLMIKAGCRFAIALAKKL